MDTDWSIIFYGIKFVLRALIGTASCTAGFIFVFIGWDPTALSMIGLGLIGFGLIVAIELVQETVKSRDNN